MKHEKTLKKFFVSQKSQSDFSGQIKQNKKPILKEDLHLKFLENQRNTSINKFNLARAMPFLIILLLSVAMVSAGDVVAKAGDFEIDQDLTVDTNTLHVDSTNDRVGIGTIAEDAKLKVEYIEAGHSSGVYTGHGGLYIFNSNINGANQGSFLVFGSEYNDGSSKEESVAAIKGANDIYANDGAGNLQFFTSASGAHSQLYERMRISSTGNVGIGTTSPGDMVDISNNLNATLRVSSTKNDASWSDGDIIGAIDFYSADQSGAYGAGVKSSIRATQQNLHYGGYTDLKFATSFDDGNNQVRMTIDRSGKVGIGTTTPTHKLNVDGETNTTGMAIFEDKVRIGGFYSGSLDYQLRVNGGDNKGIGGVSTTDIGIFGYSTDYIGVKASGASGSYDFYADGPGTDYGTSSSLRWKENIKEIDGALDKIRNIRGVSFDWKESKYPGLSSEEKHDIGFISEEIAEVIPEIVGYGEEDGEVFPNGIDYGAITPILVEAIKELDSENSLLKTELCKKDSSYAFC